MLPLNINKENNNPMGLEQTEINTSFEKCTIMIE